MKHFNIALILAIFAALGNMAGAFLLPQRKGHTIFVNSMISIGAGCMMGVVILEMIPESMKLSEQAPLFLILGFMTAHFFEHMVAPHFHFGEETHPEAMVSKLTATSAIFGLSIHSLFDGV
jgi:zinc and cadmium transporter